MPTRRTTRERLGGILLASVLVVGGCGAAAPSAGGSKAPETLKSAAPSIDTAAGIRYAKAFVKAMNTDPLVTHIEQMTTVKQEGGGTTLEFFVSMTADFAGADRAMDLEGTAPDDSFRLRFKTIGKSAWVYQSGQWLKGKRASVKKDLAEMLDAVRVIKDPNDLRYMGQERVGKKDLQHLRANREIAYDASLGAGFWIDGHYDSYEIWIQSDGTPVRIEATFSTSSKKYGKVTGQSVMQFTKFGGPIKIKVPKNK